jgi:ADP-heptose:LPS heptosyltransferase
MTDNENILLIRLKSIGDILFLLPAVHRLRENASLLEGVREVDGVITLDRARFQSGNQCGDFNPRKTNFNLKLLVPHPGIWLKLHA